MKIIITELRFADSSVKNYVVIPLNRVHFRHLGNWKFIDSVVLLLLLDSAEMSICWVHLYTGLGGWFGLVGLGLTVNGFG